MEYKSQERQANANEERNTDNKRMASQEKEREVAIYNDRMEYCRKYSMYRMHARRINGSNSQPIKQP